MKSGTKAKWILAGFILIMVFLVVSGTVGVVVRRGGNNSSSNGGTTFKVGDESNTKMSGVTEEPKSSESETSSDGYRAEQVSGIPDMVKAIKTGTLTVEIKKGTYNEKYARLASIADKYGGYVSGSSSRTSGGTMTGGTVTLRVPGNDFSKVIDESMKLGKVESITEDTTDVTEEYVDLEGRLRNLRSQEAVYLNLMARANTIEESITVQRELSSVQSQVEQLMGRKNYLDNHISFSTLTVNLYEPGSSSGYSEEGWGFIEAVKDAIHGIVDGINVMIRIFGYSLVYIVFIAAVAAAVRFFIRKKKMREKEDEA